MTYIAYKNDDCLNAATCSKLREVRERYLNLRYADWQAKWMNCCEACNHPECEEKEELSGTGES